MSSYPSRSSSDSDDDIYDGPYYSNGRFFPTGSRPSHSDDDDEPRGFPRRAYSPPPRPRPSYPPYDDEPPRRPRSPSPPPRRRYSPPPRPRPSRSAHHNEPRPRARSPSPPSPASGYSSHRAYSPPPRRSYSSNNDSSQSSSGYSRPPPAQESSYSAPQPPRSNSPVPYTVDDEEPDMIPHAPAAWNNFTSFSTREQLVAFFVFKGFSQAVAEREVGKEFEAHAPQHRSGQATPGPSRYEERSQKSRGQSGSGGPRPNFARPPSPERFSRYRDPARDRSESPERNYGPYAGWRQQSSGTSGGFRYPPSGPSSYTRYN